VNAAYLKAHPSLADFAKLSGEIVDWLDPPASSQRIAKSLDCIR
jgi:hypothetical protein